MLKLYIPPSPGKEYWDANKREFIYSEPFEGYTLELEHSLYSISKWEEKWCRTYLSKEQKTEEQIIDYIKCMTMTKNVPDEVYENFSDENFEEVTKYLNAKHTACKIKSNKKEGQSSYRGSMCAEEIYSNMVLAQVPFECQYWNLDKLLALLECVGMKNNPPKKMSQRELMARNSKLNAARKAKHHTRG